MSGNEIKLFSAAAEKRALKTLCAGNKQSALIAAALNEDHFISDVAGDAYRRLKLMQKKRDKTLSWQDLLEDPSLPESTRKALAKDKTKVAKTHEETLQLIDTLKGFRKRRGLKDLSEVMYKKAGDADSDPEDTLVQALDMITAINLGANDFKVTTIGKKGNTAKMLKELLRGTVIRAIPTGFKTFDDINRGIMVASLMVVAANTSGGKSILVNKLARNLALNGAKVGVVPLEMENEDLLVRTMADEANISMAKFLDPKNKISPKERDRAEKRYEELEKEIAAKGGELQFIQPDEDVDIETLLMYAKPRGLDVLIVDYIGLLKGADGDDQPRALSRIARTCKRWASINKTIVILAAQLSDEGEIRYSRAIQEHASLLWKWNFTQHSRESKMIHIQQPKARQQVPFDFWLHMDPEFMRVRDLTEKETKELRGDANMSQEKRDKKYGKKEGKKKKPDYFSAL